MSELRLTFKPGVKVEGLDWRMLDAAIKVAGVYGALGHPCVITSATDDAPGRKPNSKHKLGLALDFRINNVPRETARQDIVDKIIAALGPDFDVVRHPIGKPHEHIHVEFDPKAQP